MNLPYFAVYNAHPWFLCALCTGLYPWYVVIVPMYNAPPYFSLKKLGTKVHTIHGKIW